MAIIGEGAEAKIYETRLFNRSLLLKRRVRKAYRIHELDTRLRKERTRNEARIIARLAKANMPVPRIVAAGKFSIFMEELHGTLLKDLNPSNENMQDAGELLARMHEENVVHGDFTPANIILCGNSLFLIDFGLSEMTNSQEEKALDLLLMKRSVAKNRYGVFERSYFKSYKDSKAVLNRLKEIEKRGRYQIRTLG